MNTNEIDFSDTFNDFFGTRHECLHCGKDDGELLVVSCDDQGQPSFFEHAACRDAADKRDAEKLAARKEHERLLNML